MIFLAMYKEVGAGINPYAVDYPVCVEDSSKRGLAKGGRTQRTWLLNHLLAGMSDEIDKSAIRQLLKLEPVSSYEPCADDYMTTYLNQASVKTAIHVKSDVEWVDCSRSIRYLLL